MTQEEFDKLFEDEHFRKEIWVLIMLYLYIKETGADEVRRSMLSKDKNPFYSNEQE